MKNNLRKLRLARGLTLKNVADALGTSNQQISRLETGTGARLNEDWINKLCGFYNVGIAELFGEISPSASSGAAILLKIANKAIENGEDPRDAIEAEYKKWGDDLQSVIQLIQTTRLKVESKKTKV